MMDTKQRNIVKWLKTFVAKRNIDKSKLIGEIPYPFVAIKTELIYDGRWRRCDRLKSVLLWLSANINRDRYVICRHNEHNKKLIVQYDNSLWDYGSVFGVAFQHDSDAVMFKLALSELLFNS